MNDCKFARTMALGCAVLILGASVDGQPVAVTTIAVRGQSVPGLTNELFQDFSTSEAFALNNSSGPCISADGAIAFSAATNAVREGVWANYDGRVVRLVNHGTVPFSNVQVPIESLRDAAFSPRPVWKGYLLTEIKPSVNGNQTALARFGPDGAQCIVSYGSTYPGPGISAPVTSTGVSGFGAGDVDEFVVGIETGYSYETGFLRAIRRISGQTVWPLLSTGDPAPGFPQNSQTILSSALLVGPSGKIVTGGRSSGDLNAARAIWTIENDRAALLVRANQIMPGWVPNTGFVNSNAYGTAGTTSLNKSGVVAFAGSVDTTVGRRQGIWIGAEILVVPAAAENEPVAFPDSHHLLGAPSSPRINDWNELTFEAAAINSTDSISCIWTGGVGQWFPAARAGARATVGERTLQIDSFDRGAGLRINNLGQIAFMVIGRDAAGGSANGVWVYDPIAGLRKVVTTGDVLQTGSGNTRPLTSVSFTADEVGDVRQTGLNNSGTLVFAATTEDSAGVFTVDLNRLFCRADLNRDGVLDISDIFRFLDLYFSGSPRGDFDGSGTLSAGDFYRYIDLWVSGC